MELTSIDDKDDLKLDIEPVKMICRCCLRTERHMLGVKHFNTYFISLAGLNVMELDGLPQGLCWECAALLQKAVQFKNKMLRAHRMLCQYLARCAPFPIDAEDEELSKYATPYLTNTNVLCIDTVVKAKDNVEVYQFEKQITKSELDAINLSEDLRKVEDARVKEEMGFSDYEDNITLEEIRSSEKKLTDEILATLLEGDDSMGLLTPPMKKKKKDKKNKIKVKKKARNKEKVEIEPKQEHKPSVRQAIEVDPAKIRIIKLNPQEQIKQREEESRASVKFPYQCHLCFKGFNFETKLQTHMDKHSPSRGPYKCDLCHMHLPTSYSFSVHMLIHTRRYECTVCLRRMIDRASIVEHYRSVHEGVVKQYTCNICGKVSTNNKTHRGHMRNHHSGTRPKCDQCGKTFVNKDSLSEHMQIHQGIKNYECPLCGQRFRTRTQVLRHQLKHTDAKEFYCVECDVRFKTSQTLRQHLLRSSKHKDWNSLKHTCTRCEKRFASESNLALHISIHHEGIRAHVCSACGAGLATRASLAKHMYTIHQNMRPAPRHVCDTCGKAFRGKSVLVNHVRTHTGEKPFACGECGRAFAQRTAMRTHVKLVHLRQRRADKAKPTTVPVELKMDLAPKTEPAARAAIDQWRPTQYDAFFKVTAGP